MKEKQYKDNVMTVEALREWIGLEAETIRRKAAKNEIPAVKIWGRWYFIHSEIVEHVKKNAKPNEYDREN